MSCIKFLRKLTVECLESAFPHVYRKPFLAIGSIELKITYRSTKQSIISICKLKTFDPKRPIFCPEQLNSSKTFEHYHFMLQNWGNTKTKNKNMKKNRNGF